MCMMIFLQIRHRSLFYLPLENLSRVKKLCITFSTDKSGIAMCGWRFCSYSIEWSGKFPKASNGCQFLYTQFLVVASPFMAASVWDYHCILRKYRAILVISSDFCISLLILAGIVNCIT